MKKNTTSKSDNVESLMSLFGVKVKKTIPYSSALIPIHCQDTFFLSASGNGMYPDIRSGDWLLCEMTHDLKNGDIVILFNEERRLFECKYLRTFNDHTFFENAEREIFNFAGYRRLGKVVSITRSFAGL